MNSVENPYASPVEVVYDRPGIGRLRYFFIYWSVAIGIGIGSFFYLRQTGYTSDAEFGEASWKVRLPFYLTVFVFAGVRVFITRQRLINMASSSWWCLLVFIPVLDWFVFVCCLALPTNYNNNQKLDRKATLVLWIGMPIVVIVAIRRLVGLVV